MEEENDGSRTQVDTFRTHPGDGIYERTHDETDHDLPVNLFPSLIRTDGKKIEGMTDSSSIDEFRSLTGYEIETVHTLRRESGKLITPNGDFRRVRTNSGLRGEYRVIEWLGARFALIALEFYDGWSGKAYLYNSGGRKSILIPEGVKQ